MYTVEYAIISPYSEWSDWKRCLVKANSVDEAVRQFYKEWYENTDIFADVIDVRPA